jgi:hypothetical protein
MSTPVRTMTVTTVKMTASKTGERQTTSTSFIYPPERLSLLLMARTPSFLKPGLTGPRPAFFVRVFSIHLVRAREPLHRTGHCQNGRLDLVLLFIDIGVPLGKQQRWQGLDLAVNVCICFIGGASGTLPLYIRAPVVWVLQYGGMEAVKGYWGS